MNTSPMTLRFPPLARIVLALPLCACASETHFKPNRRLLDDALAALEANQLPTAVQKAEAVVLRTQAEPGPYVLQRFFGAYLAAQAHLSAAAGGAFLEDTADQDETGIRLGEAAATLEVEDVAVAHLVAAMYHAGLGIEWLARAEKAPAHAEKQAVLPPELEKLGAKDAGINLLLSQIAVFARLRFQGRVDRLLRQSGREALHRFETCKEIVDRVQVRPWVGAWLDYALYDFLRGENPVAAYKFAVDAVARGGDSKGTFPRGLMNQIEDWVVKNPEYEWICPRCANTSPPSLPRCIHCEQVLVIEFTARKKPTS